MEEEEQHKKKIHELLLDSTAFKVIAVALACLLAVGITVGGYFVVKDVVSAKKQVPSLLDLKESAAREKSEAAGLKCRFEYDDDTRTGDEVVTEQSFSPGAKVDGDTTIILTMKDDGPDSTLPPPPRRTGVQIPACPLYRTPVQRAANQASQMWEVTCTPSSMSPRQTCTLRADFLRVVPKSSDELWFVVKVPNGKKYGIKVDTIESGSEAQYKTSYTTTFPLRVKFGDTSQTGLYQVFFVDTEPAMRFTGRYPLLLNGSGCGEFTVAVAVASAPIPSTEPQNLDAPPAMLNFGCWEAEDLSYYLSKGSIYPKPTHVPRCGAYEYADVNHIRYVIFQDYEEDGWDPNNPATYPWKTTEIRVIDDNHIQLVDAGLMGPGPVTFTRIN